LGPTYDTSAFRAFLKEVGRVKRYDLYVYEPDTEVVIGWHKLKAEDSKSAYVIAHSLGLSGRIELWEDDSVVKRWEAP
jgi:hypothetical protein